ncbi:NAD(P)H-binding protein [Actinacidiphila acididurans]|uniref:NAD(P)H-binding protein n=1 Tax=Actinacidiphila acididurans TaxID=2784346 RepID=A0ABS2TVV2_9ACTN|nr:NAD(P)H-binding protein [Actinacidiphila acididurans]MBM9507456.1 NAD(P)H-binding protein [Actinacidiphila acididurans]
MMNRVVVIGGGGRLGRLLVGALARRGAQVEVVSRQPAATRHRLPRGVGVHGGDVRDARSLTGPLAGCGAVVFAAETGFADDGPDSPRATLYEGVANTVDAARTGSKAPRVLLVSQICVTRPEHPTNAYGRLLDWRLAGEEVVRDSGLPYTVVRPGWFDDAARHGGIRLDQGDAMNGFIRREDCAETIAEALASPATVGVTFEVFNEPAPAAAAGVHDWPAMFGALDADLDPVR